MNIDFRVKKLKEGFEVKMLENGEVIGIYKDTSKGMELPLGVEINLMSMFKVRLFVLKNNATIEYCEENAENKSQEKHCCCKCCKCKND